MSLHSLGLIGVKAGTTSLFIKDSFKMVTVIRIDPNYITQLKTIEKDGYTALQLTTGERKKQRVPSALQGHYKKALMNSDADQAFGAILREFRVDDLKDYQIGQKIACDIFAPIGSVDVTGISKGKGFAGVMKRHNFGGQCASHGNSVSHRVHGSTGQNQSPGRVFKGKKMAGHMGSERVTAANLTVLEVNVEKNYILVEGSVPGAPGGYVLVKPAVKSRCVL
ncbi:MAG: 50S ribosomal protein L3 [Gammaproteobacteria bacterium]|nr:50S ribosomal protein L3 [Gammaproteobacteria bacterium]